MTEIIAALKLIPELISAVKAISAGIERLQDAMTQKNIEELKHEVNSSLVKLKEAKSNSDRRKLIEELNKKLSK